MILIRLSIYYFKGITSVTIINPLINQPELYEKFLTGTDSS